jgi:hypothetical protein
MNLPLPFSALVFTGAGGTDTVTEIQLNRSGINSIDVPREKILVEIGSTLRLKLLNRGAPIHITITTSNASGFTDFFHENMYVVDESLLSIAIRPDCQEGFFDLELISGYGVMKSSVNIEVRSAQSLRPVVREEIPLQPVAHGRPHLLMVMMGIALILFSAWLYTNIEILNIASFIILIVGALYIWYRPR